ncbi:trehalose-phosphatase [Vreelandella rituensis]|uniref:Trehalose 6-phosphate phosphatase n=1 Tax=Vreelandella rituensis TaxID=2282306 RepID=A0A368TYQ7_9GAMM|nr:trehalose-phosphatase [Halomonas rituensis]RCV88103.1 trehalose-phosphatase [Halomonas rituensis]
MQKTDRAKQGFNLACFSAGVFDLDGVVTDTANVHCAAWEQLFDDYLRSRAQAMGERFEPFNASVDYPRYVDGKPRYQGVESFLASRSITLAYGSPDDPPERETICGLGNRKDRLFRERLAKDGVDVFDSSVALIQHLRDAGLKIALVSSSKNAAAVLETAGLSHLFDAHVDGNDIERRKLKGKPDSDIFLLAASLLEVSPSGAFAVEDALSGVEAARAAGYALVVGVDRADQRDALLEHGADIVVDDLGELMPDSASSESTLPNALVCYEEIAHYLADKRLVIFLDYDGTLTPIVDRPELAVLSDDMRETLGKVAERFTVAIVSGRDRADVEQLVALDNLIYAGSHGFDIAGPGGLHMQQERAQEFLPALDHAEAELKQKLNDIEGVIVERKRYAIAVHYRLVAAEHLETIEEAVAQAVEASASMLRRTGGKKIFELRPTFPWDKGKALNWLLDALVRSGKVEPSDKDILPLYFGDDETDEDAFKVLREGQGLGLLVAEAPQPTEAHYWLEDPQAVGRFLQRLCNADGELP